MFFAEPLREDHDLSSFSSGNDELDDWLHDSAWNATRAGTARTQLWLDADGAVVAYYASAPHLISRDELPKKVGRGAPPIVPGYLLAKLALSTELQGHLDRYGSVLLVDALAWVLEAARQAGGKVVLVDAIDDAAVGYYEHHGFKPTPIERRLYMKFSDVAASLDVPWP